jgi:hypothetical protein
MTCNNMDGQMFPVLNTLSAIADTKSLALLNTIAISPYIDSNILMSKLRLTRKQYYSRMSVLLKSGLIRRKNGKHFLSSYGKVVYSSCTLIENTIKDYWGLKALDSIKFCGQESENEYNQVVNALIANYKIKDILLSHTARAELNKVTKYTKS